MVLRINLSKDMILGLVKGRGLCLQLEVEDSTAEISAGKVTRPRSFVETSRGGDGR